MKSIKIKLAFSLFGLVILSLSCGRESKVKIHENNLYWETSNPEAEGIDPMVIDSIHQEIERGKYGLIDHFLLIRNGKVVFDNQYDQDYETIAMQYDTTNHQYNYDHPSWHPYYNYTSLHSLQSVTKSVTSILLGIAIDEGLIPNTDAQAMSFFSTYEAGLADDRRKSINLENLLTMQSGIEWDEESYDGQDDCSLMEGSDNWIQYVLDKPMDTIPGVAFEYNSGVSVLIGKIVGLASGKRIDQWAEEKLFGPLGITDYYWKETPKGEIDTEGGLYLSSYDLAKIGYLMLNEGTWENKQVVSRKWVEASSRPLAKVNDKVAYGYQWWVPKHEDGRAEILAGQGYGGQYVMMVPEYNILLVLNGWNIHDRAEKSSYGILEDRIIPSISKD
jgi:CubicO group peptidase (beta-lactamase class C family)